MRFPWHPLKYLYGKVDGCDWEAWLRCEFPYKAKHTTRSELHLNGFYLNSIPARTLKKQTREKLRLETASVTDTSKASDDVYSIRTSYAPFLSVRTAFDLYLKALRLPRGSLVVCSPLTIPDMVTILCEHGLVPLPIDLDPSTLAPNPRALEAEVSRRRVKSGDGDPEARVRAIYVAHVFGAQVRWFCWDQG